MVKPDIVCFDKSLCHIIHFLKYWNNTYTSFILRLKKETSLFWHIVQIQESLLDPKWILPLLNTQDTLPEVLRNHVNFVLCYQKVTFPLNNCPWPRSLTFWYSLSSITFTFHIYLSNKIILRHRNRTDFLITVIMYVQVNVLNVNTLYMVVTDSVSNCQDVFYFYEVYILL